MTITTLSKQFGKTPLLKTHELKLYLTNTTAQIEQYDKSPYLSFLSLLTYTTAVVGEPCAHIYCNQHYKVLFIADQATNNELHETIYYHINDNSRLLAYAHSNLTIMDEEDCTLEKLEELDKIEQYDIIILNGFYASTPDTQTSLEDIIDRLNSIATNYNTSILVWDCFDTPLISNDNKIHADIYQGRNFPSVCITALDTLIYYRIMPEGTLSLPSTGTTPPDDELKELFRTLLTKKTWNARTLEYEYQPMPKFKNELIRILTTTNICDKIQSASHADNVINKAVLSGIITKTKDEDMIQRCNTKQAIKNHFRKNSNFVYTFIG